MAASRSIAVWSLLAVVGVCVSFGGGYLIGRETQVQAWPVEVAVLTQSDQMSRLIEALDAIRKNKTNEAAKGLQMQLAGLVVLLDSSISPDEPLAFGPAQKAYSPLYRLAQRPHLLPSETEHATLRASVDARLERLLDVVEEQRNAALLRDLKEQGLTEAELRTAYEAYLKKLTPQQAVARDGL